MTDEEYKSLARWAVYTAIPCAVLYGFFSFIAGTVNAMEWATAGRVALVVLWAVIMVAVGIGEIQR